MDLFSGVDLVNKTINATLIRRELISQNLSHSDTPNYKRVDIDFESALKKEIKRSNGQIQLENLDNVPIYTDHQTTAYRLDGNNIDIEVEKAEEAKNDMRYYALVTRLNSQLNRMNTILQNLK